MAALIGRRQRRQVRIPILKQVRAMLRLSLGNLAAQPIVLAFIHLNALAVSFEGLRSRTHALLLLIKSVTVPNLFDYHGVIRDFLFLNEFFPQRRYVVPSPSFSFHEREI
jgi:hypothetical protein